MRLKHLRDWGDDAIWITFAVTLLVTAAAVAWLIMPP